MQKVMVCGTRSKKNYANLVNEYLDNIKGEELLIIQGCCENSADVYARDWAIKNNVKYLDFPGNPGNYLKRNIDMVKASDAIFAFWDGYSYGTAQAIATGVKLGKRVYVWEVKKW